MKIRELELESRVRTLEARLDALTEKTTSTDQKPSTGTGTAGIIASSEESRASMCEAVAKEANPKFRILATKKLLEGKWIDEAQAAKLMRDAEAELDALQKRNASTEKPFSAAEAVKMQLDLEKTLNAIQDTEKPSVEERLSLIEQLLVKQMRARIADKEAELERLRKREEVLKPLQEQAAAQTAYIREALSDPSFIAKVAGPLMESILSDQPSTPPSSLPEENKEEAEVLAFYAKAGLNQEEAEGALEKYRAFVQAGGKPGLAAMAGSAMAGGAGLNKKPDTSTPSIDALAEATGKAVGDLAGSYVGTATGALCGVTAARRDVSEEMQLEKMKAQQAQFCIDAAAKKEGK